MLPTCERSHRPFRVEAARATPRHPQPSLSLSSLLRQSRNAALAAARGVGAFRIAAQSRWRQRRLMVLCFHGVALDDEHEWSALYVSAAHLDRRLRQLRTLGCNVLPLGEALARRAANDLPPRAVALTFDDGSADFHTRAWPLLAREGTPAMLYQSTWYVDKPFPVFNPAVSYLLWKGRGRRLILPWCGTEVVVPPRTDHPAFRALHDGVRAWVARNRLDAEAQTALLAELARRVDVPFESLLERRLLHLMSSAQLRDLDPALIDVQLHTHRHRTAATRDGFLQELEDNARVLRRVLGDGHDLAHFCYPSGEYNAQVVGWLREWGVRSATTCDTGIVHPDTDVLRLPRLVDSMQTPDEVFEAWMTGMAAFFPSRRPA